MKEEERKEEERVLLRPLGTPSRWFVQIKGGLLIWTREEDDPPDIYISSISITDIISLQPGVGGRLLKSGIFTIEGSNKVLVSILKYLSPTNYSFP